MGKKSDAVKAASSGAGRPVQEAVVKRPTFIATCFTCEVTAFFGMESDRDRFAFHHSTGQDHTVDVVNYPAAPDLRRASTEELLNELARRLEVHLPGGLKHRAVGD